jgi:outer membrane protein assembly factor BamB
MLARQIFALLLVIASCAPVLAQDSPDWPQWRGPTRDGQVLGRSWPTSLKKENFTQAWRVELGPGYPGPIVAKDRVFVAETKDKKFEVVRALDRATGKQIWESSWEGAMSVPFFARSNGDWIRSTPAYDGKNIYVGGMRDLLVCLDAATGKKNWQVDFAKENKTGLPAFGFVSSPVVDGDHVYVQAGASLAKVDKNTGKIAWQILKDSGGAYESAFSSPTFATIQGRKQLLVQTRVDLAGIDAADGTILWKQKVPAYKNMNILTPLVNGDSVFTSTYGEKSFRYDVKKKDDQFNVDLGWATKSQGYMSSPVLVNDHVYLHLKNQNFTCINLKTGKETWTTSERFGQYWSMAAQGDKILALDERGILYFIQANPEKFELIDQLKVSTQPSWGHLAISGNEVFIRELNAVAAYRWTDGKK